MADTPKAQELKAKIDAQGGKVRDLKSSGAAKVSSIYNSDQFFLF